MTESDFKSLFVCQFLASYAANIYEECCLVNQHERLENLPVEDAKFIAAMAWQAWSEDEANS